MTVTGVNGREREAGHSYLFKTKYENVKKHTTIFSHSVMVCT